MLQLLLHVLFRDLVHRRASVSYLGNSRYRRRQAQYSIRINRQWRICFHWTDAGPEDVEIVHGHRRITADTALRLARYFGTSERFWINLQARYDLEIQKDRPGQRRGHEPLTGRTVKRQAIRAARGAASRRTAGTTRTAI